MKSEKIRNSYELKYLLVSIVLISLIFTSNISDVFGVASLILSPTIGSQSSTVTASGTGFTTSNLNYAVSTKPYQAAGGNTGQNGKIILQEFTGLPTSNSQITKVGVDISATGSTQQSRIRDYHTQASVTGLSGNVLLWQLTGLDPNTILNNLQIYFGLTGSAQQSIVRDYHTQPSLTNLVGNVLLWKITGLDPNTVINKLQLYVGAAAGNINVLVYDDQGSGGTPKNLLAASGSQAVSGTGYQNYTTGSPTVPSDGVVWVGMEVNNNSFGVAGVNQGCPTDAGLLSKFAESFGTNSNPAGATSDACEIFTETVFYTPPTPQIRIKTYNDTSGSPSNLLSESSALTISGTGYQNYTTGSPTVPSSGKIWVGFEVTNVETGIAGVNQGCPTDAGYLSKFTHIFGIGPNPAGSVSDACEVLTETVFYTPPTPQIRVKIYSDPSGSPSSLLGEQLTNIISTGFMNTTLTTPVTIPSNGKVWAGWEFSNVETGIIGYMGCPTYSGYSYYFTHIFGVGPNTAGSISDNCGAMYNQITYSNSTPVTFTWDKTTQLTTSPTPVFTDSNGAFSGVTFTVPNSATSGSHTVNASDTGGKFATASFTIPATVSLRPDLSDNSTQLTSAKVKVTNSSTSQTLTANSTGWVKFTGLSGNQNFTVFDDKNFESLKIINQNIQSSFSKNLATYDYAFNCFGSLSGYQSDFIIRVNDTDGHHITNITTPTCPNRNSLVFNMTFTANGQSSSSYSSEMLTGVGNIAFQTNPTSFTVSGTTVPTVFTGSNNIFSNPFSIGSGLTTFTKQFILNFTTTSSTASGGAAGGSGAAFTTNSTCFAGVYNTGTQSCQFGPVNVTIQPVTITSDPNQQNTGNIGVLCNGAGSITVTSVDLGSNPLGIQVGQLPMTTNCGPPTPPSSCPAGTTLQNGQCVGQFTCPISSQTQNGVCVGQLICPAGTTLTNGQCIAPATCPEGSTLINGLCQSNTIPITTPPTPPTCDILNPLTCITSTTTSENVVVSATTPDGQKLSIQTSISKTLNPELNNVSLVIITLVIAAVIGGVLYRYFTQKPKGKRQTSTGKDKSIKEFNKQVRKN